MSFSWNRKGEVWSKKTANLRYRFRALDSIIDCLLDSYLSPEGKKASPKFRVTDLDVRKVLDGSVMLKVDCSLEHGKPATSINKG